MMRSRSGSGRIVTVLESERLVLRNLDLNDAQFIRELLNEEAFIRFIGDKGVRSLADARNYITRGPMHSYRRLGFGLYLTSLRDGTPIGICGLVKRDALIDVDLGFAFLAKFRMLGYAAESAAAVLGYAKRTLRMSRIVAIAAPENHGSIAVLQKTGLTFERMIRLSVDGPELRLFGVDLLALPAQVR